MLPSALGCSITLTSSNVTKATYLSVQFNAETLSLLWLQTETFEMPVAAADFHRPTGIFLWILSFCRLCTEEHVNLYGLQNSIEPSPFILISATRQYGSPLI
jgi:hypothetical protein